MKKLAVILMTMMVGLTVFAGCDKTEKPASDASDAVVESQDAGTGEEESTEESDASTGAGDSSSSEIKDLFAPKSLEIVDGTLVEEEGVIAYTTTSSYDDVKEVIEKGIKTLGATELMQTEMEGVYAYTGTYGDNVQLTVAIAPNPDGTVEGVTVYITYAQAA